MQRSIATDIEKLKNPDPVIHNVAFENIIKRKSDAVPALIELLEKKNEEGRVLAAAALANIADTSSSDILLKFTDDTNEKVRAWSSIALKRMNDPRALESLLKNIGDYPDELHNDQTLVTYALVQWGEVILLPLLKLLNAPKPETRKHALSVLKKIVYNKAKSKRAWDELWKENGAYNPDAKEAVRIASILKWEQWINRNIS